MKEGGDNPSAVALAPLYERLPRGPHQLKPREVAENQRNRMHGAIVEAVATNGYGRTSVKQIVALAGVSRRAFYEQFANKQECFLATLDLISSRALEEISDAYRGASGGLEERMGTALAACAEIVVDNPNSARMLMIEAPSAGPAGWVRLTKTLTIFEERLAMSFAHAPDTAPLPTPVVRGIVGGLRRITLARLRGGRVDELPGLVSEMLSWTLVFKTAEPGQLAGLALRALRSGQHDHSLLGAGANATESTPKGERALLLSSALELAEIEGYGNVTPLRIADGAGVSIDVFFDLFEDMQECFLTAIGEVGDEIRKTLADTRSASQDWPTTVRQTLGALMHHLAMHPTYAHAIATGVFTMGERAVELTAELASDIVAVLIAGAPEPAVSELVQEGIEGAIWQTIYCQATSGRTELLPKLTDYLAYIVLASVLGAEEAARIVTNEDATSSRETSAGVASAAQQSE